MSPLLLQCYKVNCCCCSGLAVTNCKALLVVIVKHICMDFLGREINSNFTIKVYFEMWKLQYCRAFLAALMAVLVVLDFFRFSYSLEFCWELNAKVCAFPSQELRAVVQQLQAELQDKAQQIQAMEWEKCRELQAQEQRVQCLSQHLARKEQLLQVRCRKTQTEHN